MTDIEINVAIAELCGFEWYRLPSRFNEERRYRFLALPAIHEYEGQSKEWLERSDGTERLVNWYFLQHDCHVSNYVDDLNACHEMEKTLTDDNSLQGRVSYNNTLMRICGSHAACISATARQRAEAFLRLKGKWVEDHTGG